MNEKAKKNLWQSSVWSQGAQPDGQILALHSPVEGFVALTVHEPGGEKTILSKSGKLLCSLYQRTMTGSRRHLTWWKLKMFWNMNLRTLYQPSWRLVGCPCLSHVSTYWSRLASSIAKSWKGQEEKCDQIIMYFLLDSFTSQLRYGGIKSFDSFAGL